MPVKNNLIGPSVATGPWTPEMVWDTGFIGAYAGNMAALAVEQYVFRHPNTTILIPIHLATPITTASPSSASAPLKTLKQSSQTT